MGEGGSVGREEVRRGERERGEREGEEGRRGREGVGDDERRWVGISYSVHM